MESKQYEIWCEGFVTMESKSGAQLLGKVRSTSFKSAVVEFFNRHDKTVNNYFDEKNMRFYGCELFDNEADARKTFG